MKLNGKRPERETATRKKSLTNKKLIKLFNMINMCARRVYVYALNGHPSMLLLDRESSFLDGQCGLHTEWNRFGRSEKAIVMIPY